MPAAIHRPAGSNFRYLWSNTTAVTKGQIKIIGEGLPAIATEAIAAGAIGNWEIPYGVQYNVTMHTTGFTAIVGDYAYLIAASHAVSTIATANTKIGVFLSAPAASGANAVVLLATVT